MAHVQYSAFSRLHSSVVFRGENIKVMVTGNIAERLPWDSTFFGMSIQRMTADGSLTAATLRRETCDADCTYVFCAPG